MKIFFTVRYIIVLAKVTHYYVTSTPQWRGYSDVRASYTINQWFLTWVRSNPRGSLSQSQAFGRGQEF